MTMLTHAYYTAYDKEDFITLSIPVITQLRKKWTECRPHIQTCTCSSPAALCDCLDEDVFSVSPSTTSDSRELWQDKSDACCSFSLSRSFALSLSLRRFFSALLSFVVVVVVVVVVAAAVLEVAVTLEPDVPEPDVLERDEGACSKPFCCANDACSLCSTSDESGLNWKRKCLTCNVVLNFF